MAELEKTTENYRKNLDALDKEILSLLKDIKDPEINESLVDLGLIYDIQKLEKDKYKIVLTFTTPMCPWGGMLIEEVKNALAKKNYIAEIELSFEPLWTPDFMAKELREKFSFL